MRLYYKASYVCENKKKKNWHDREPESLEGWHETAQHIQINKKGGNGEELMIKLEKWPGSKWK